MRRGSFLPAKRRHNFETAHGTRDILLEQFAECRDLSFVCESALGDNARFQIALKHHNCGWCFNEAHERIPSKFVTGNWISEDQSGVARLQLGAAVKRCMRIVDAPELALSPVERKNDN